MGPLWCWWCVACAALPAARAVVGGAPAAAPPPDAAVVFLQKHGRSARVEGFRHDAAYYKFLGIRYAAPPVGARRFQRPARLLLRGDVDATRACAPCPQRGARGAEDCLCLSVFAPRMPGEETGSPVIVFIHGGNYKSGSAVSYGGQHFAQKDTLIVVIQYRLGALGFLSTGQQDAAGNMGLFDIYAAINWVKDYIEFFGGDPSRIVVMGQGSGGSAASLVGLSGQGRAGPRGAVQGVVALSGAPLSPGAVRADPAAHAQLLANKTNCPPRPPEKLVNCLRKLSIEDIVKADAELDMDIADTQKFLDDISGRSGSGARVEGADDKRALPPFVSENPSDSLKKTEDRCPMLIGVTSAETARAVYGKNSNMLVDKLQQIKDFIEKDVVGGLRRLAGGVRGLLPVSVSTKGLPFANYYQTLFKNTMKPVEGLAKIAEATGDALFNYPAFQSVRAWRSAAPAFLYSFEYAGNLTSGSHFLPGMTLTDDKEQIARSGNAKGPAHGDDLAYLFEPLDENGEAIEHTVSAPDAKVRDSFVGLIAKFAHSVGPLNSKNTSKLMSFMPYSKDDDHYFKITADVTVDKNFRYCQMGIWGGMGDRLTGALCKGLLGSLPVPLPVPADLPVPVPMPVPVPGVPNVFGGNNKNKNQNGGLFGFNGLGY